MSTAILGVGGARRNACAAVCVDGSVVAACEQERLTRVRHEGLGAGWAAGHLEAVDEVLALAHREDHADVTVAVAEQEARPPMPWASVAIDHHRGHAATAFLTSPFPSASVLVCDSHRERSVSVWRGNAWELEDQHWPWRGPGFAALYGQSAGVFGLAPERGELQLEALAHQGSRRDAGQWRDVFAYAAGAVECAPRWQATMHERIAGERQRGTEQPADTAAAVQHRIGEMLLDLVAEIRTTAASDALCLGGGLFYNTYFTSLVRGSGIFSDVFVPINPGNTGLSVGAGLDVGGRSESAAVSPYLGPEYDAYSIKSVLDGCKLSYAFVTEAEALDATVDALTRGQLVGWFQGRMEWGPRALGHRSILANPCSPYVLDNLNCFLRKRSRSRAFGVSVREHDAQRWFRGPARSRYMEYEYELVDDRLRFVMPDGATSLRVQTVPAEETLFSALHQRMEHATGCGVLVNTSFNGFREPIVCTPRDAIRVFYGTGLDMLVMGRFILRK
jgi:carbamoyltransferase